MSSKDIWILGVHLSDRSGEAEKVQAVLTKFGCSIRTRLGLHQVQDEFCSKAGLILLELTGDTNEFMKLENALLEIEGLEVKKMIFRE